MGKDLVGMNLATVIIYDNRELQLHESEWKHSMHRRKVDKEKTIQVVAESLVLAVENISLLLPKLL